MPPCAFEEKWPVSTDISQSYSKETSSVNESKDVIATTLLTIPSRLGFSPRLKGIRVHKYPICVAHRFHQ